MIISARGILPTRSIVHTYGQAEMSGKRAVCEAECAQVIEEKLALATELDKTRTTAAAATPS